MVKDMDSNQLFERRDELRHVINELKQELKDLDEKLSDTFLDTAVMPYAQTVKTLVLRTL